MAVQPASAEVNQQGTRAESGGQTTARRASNLDSVSAATGATGSADGVWPGRTGTDRPRPDDTGKPEARPDDTGEPEARPDDTGEPEAGPDDTGEPEAGPDGTRTPETRADDTGDRTEMTPAPRSAKPDPATPTAAGVIAHAVQAILVRPSAGKALVPVTRSPLPVRPPATGKALTPVTRAPLALVTRAPLAILRTRELAPAPAPATGRRRAPGLDGVRALAVLAVLAFHENLPWIPGGFLGVDVFFVLSGYLITDLLAAAHQRNGTVGLTRFWQRRARRLLPPLAIMLVTVTAAVAVLEPQQIGPLRSDLLGAVTYTSNWWQAFAHVSYFGRYGPPAPLEHLWSLAVEEQFYLVWPLILTVTLAVLARPAHRALVAWGGAVLSALVMLAIYRPGSDPSLVYYGTDTHASALMIGSALALTWPLATVTAARKRLRLDVVGVAGLAILGWSMWHFSGANPAVYPFGLVLAALGAGGLVLAAAAPGRIGRALAVKPLRWLGVRSYAIYLWHWPVIAVATGLDPRAAQSLPVRAFETAVPILLAAGSWHFVEEPILRDGLRSVARRRGTQFAAAIKACVRPTPAALPPAIARLGVAAAVLAVSCAAGYGLMQRRHGPTLQSQIAAGQRVTGVAQSSGSRQPGTGPGTPGGALRGQPGWPPVQPNRWWTRIGVRSVPAAVSSRRPAPLPGRQVQAVGDSVMLASAPELARAIPGISINAQVSRAMIAGVGIVRQMAAAGRLRKVVVVGLGTNGPVSMNQVGALRSAIGSRRWLILINTFVPRPWEQEVNGVLAAAARRFPNVLLVNWHGAIEHHTDLLWSDGIHPQPVGGGLYARIVRSVVLRALHTNPPLPRPAAVRMPAPAFAPTTAGRPYPMAAFLRHASGARL